MSKAAMCLFAWPQLALLGAGAKAQEIATPYKGCLNGNDKIYDKLQKITRHHLLFLPDSGWTYVQIPTGFGVVQKAPLSEISNIELSEIRPFYKNILELPSCFP